MAKNCYICNKTVHVWHQDLTELKLTYAEFSISFFLKKFLMDFQSNRNVDDKLNCICEKCFNRIKVYDWFLKSANEKKDGLRRLFMKTEKLFEVAFENDKMSEIDAETEVNGNNDENRDDISNHSEENVELISTADDDEEGDDFEIYELGDKSQTCRLPVVAIEVEPITKEEFENDDDAMETNSNIEGADENHDTDGSVGSIEASNELNSLVRTVSNIQNSINDELETQKSTITNAASILKMGRPCVYHKCDICNDGIQYTRKELKKHSKKHERKCEICGLEFGTARNLRDHMKVHEKYEELVCLTCLYKCDSKDAYKEHIALHVNKPDSQCVLCDKFYKKKSITRRHVQVAHMNSMLLCEICGKSFAYHLNLSEHRRRHQSERPEKCTFCPKTFKTKDALKVHKRTHTQTERPFACAFCDMKFKLKFHWQQHERRHKENTKTLKCVLCESAFEHKFHLNQHMERKHGVQVPSGSGSQRKVEVIN